MINIIYWISICGNELLEYTVSLMSTNNSLGCDKKKKTVQFWFVIKRKPIKIKFGTSLAKLCNARMLIFLRAKFL